MNFDVKETGMRIRQLRSQLNYTQEEFAKALNTDRSNLSRIEAGSRGPSLDLLIQLSTMFDVSLDYIILGQDQSAMDAEKRNKLKEKTEQLIIQLQTFNATL